MPYVSLYRKYRPQTFDEVVGQEHVTATIKNAVIAGRVGSGYLFTGTRGTAKTTCARILAKALNCIGEDGLRTSPAPVPCGVCGPCRSIAASSFVDVLEMDAASHGKVDDVRDLVSSIKFPPMEGRYKVYIIDEAHQLSRDAMDAFLKTLEEPPDRVVFVLATTELDKLPITIASRCQVFEFKRGSVAAISSRISVVLNAEGVKADPAAITLIARAADGSYRDSLSLLEQVLAYKPDDILPSDVALVLGTVDEDMLSDIVARVAAHDTAGAFAAADAITSSGKDVQQFLRTLSGRMRDMLFVAVGASAREGEITASARRDAALMPQPILLRALEILSETERDMKWSSQHRLVLEIALLRLCALTEHGLPTGHDTRMTVEPSTHANSGGKRPTPIAQQQPVRHPAAQAPPSAIAPEPPKATAPIVVETLTTSDAGSTSQPPLHTAEPIRTVSPPPQIPNGTGDPESNGQRESSAPLAPETELLQVQQVPADAPSMDVAPTYAANGPADLIRLQKAWQEVVNRVGSRSGSGAAALRDATPLRLDGGIVTLKFSNPLFVDRLEKNERGRQFVEEMINRTLGVEPNTYRIKSVLTDSAAQTQPPPARQLTAPAVTAPVHEEPGLIETVIAVFGGQVQED